MKVLVTGGVRSGKSRHAEGLLASRVAGGQAVYVATGPTERDDPDPDWAARLDAHRTRRPEAWSTVETQELAEAIRSATAPVLVDCLGTWLTAVLDAADGWELPVRAAAQLVEDRAVDLLDALRSSSLDLVLVTNEVGLGVVPEHRSGRLFRDLLGTLNQQVATVCDEVHLVVAGRVLVL